ncbi:ricin B lectin domain-containing protein [Mycena haematopus]|nr:ricin B lectin domain-containing protein [Mycena haematopus]
MLSPVLLTLATISLSVAAVEIQSENPAFYNAGIQGCIAAADNANGEPLIIHNCNTENPANQDWDVSFFTRQNAGPQQIKIFGDKVWTVKFVFFLLTDCLPFNDGTKLQIWTCVEGNTNQQWISVTDSTFRWSGTDKCIDLTNGVINDGNVLQIWTCSTGNTNQKWTGAPNPDTVETVQITGGNHSANGGGPYCIAAASATNGAEVALVACSDLRGTFPNGNVTWTVPVPPLTGQIKTFSNKFCLDVPNGSTANGVKLQIWTCTPGNTNQNFQTHNGLAQIEWNGSGKCIDLTNGISKSGTPIQMWDCAVPNNNPNQQWSL